MFDMSNDSGVFRTREQLETENWKLEGNMYCKDKERYLPLYEAKLFHQYDHRFATFDGASARDRKNGKARLLTPAEKSDPNAVALPRYWVPESEVAKRLGLEGNHLDIADQTEQNHTRPPRRTGAQVAFRQITNATNERTGVFSMIPMIALGHSAAILIIGSSTSEQLPVQPTNERVYSP